MMDDEPALSEWKLYAEIQRDRDEAAWVAQEVSGWREERHLIDEQTSYKPSVSSNCQHFYGKHYI